MKQTLIFLGLIIILMGAVSADNCSVTTVGHVALTSGSECNLIGDNGVVVAKFEATGDNNGFTWKNNEITIDNEQLLITFETTKVAATSFKINGYVITGLVQGDSISYVEKIKGVKIVSGKDNHELIVNVEGLDYTFLLNNGDYLTTNYDSNSKTYYGVITLGANIKSKGKNYVPIQVCGKEQYFFGIMGKVVNSGSLSGPQLGSSTRFEFYFDDDIHGKPVCSINLCKYAGYVGQPLATGGGLVAWCGEDYPKFETINTYDANMEYSNSEWTSDSTGKVKLYPFDEVNYLQVDSFTSYSKDGTLIDDSFYVGDDTNGYKIKPNDKETILGRGLKEGYFKLRIDSGEIIYNFDDVNSGVKEKIKLTDANTGYYLNYENNKLILIDCCKLGQFVGDLNSVSTSDEWGNDYYGCNIGEGIKNKLFQKEFIEYSPFDGTCVLGGVSTEKDKTSEQTAEVVSESGISSTGSGNAKSGASSSTCGAKDGQKDWTCSCGAREYLDPNFCVLSKNENGGLWTATECKNKPELCGVGQCRGTDNDYYCCAPDAETYKEQGYKTNAQFTGLLSRFNEEGKSQACKTGKPAAPGSITNYAETGYPCLIEGTYACMNDQTSIAKCVSNYNFKPEDLGGQAYIYAGGFVWKPETSATCRDQICDVNKCGVGIFEEDSRKCCVGTGVGGYCDYRGVKYACNPDDRNKNTILDCVCTDGIEYCNNDGSLCGLGLSCTGNGKDTSISNLCEADVCVDGTFKCDGTDQVLECTDNSWYLAEVCSEVCEPNGCKKARDAQGCCGSVIEAEEEFTGVCDTEDKEKYPGEFTSSQNGMFACYELDNKYYPSACKDTGWKMDTACIGTKSCGVSDNDAWCSDGCDTSEYLGNFEYYSDNKLYACYESDGKYYPSFCLSNGEWQMSKACIGTQYCDVADNNAWCSDDDELSTTTETEECVYDVRNIECLGSCEGTLSCGVSGTFRGDSGELIMECQYNDETGNYEWADAGVCELSTYCRQDICNTGGSVYDCCFSRSPAPSTSVWSLFKANTQRALNLFIS